MCNVRNIEDSNIECIHCKNKKVTETRIYKHKKYAKKLRYCWGCYQRAFIEHNYKDIPCKPYTLDESESGYNKDLIPDPDAWSIDWESMITRLEKDYGKANVLEQKTYIPKGEEVWPDEGKEDFFKDLLCIKHVRGDFVYIKGCIDDEDKKIYPIVAGRTKASNPDFSFTDFAPDKKNNSTSRYLLSRTKILKKYCETVIIIRCPVDGKNANTIEDEIQMKYRLFG